MVRLAAAASIVALLGVALPAAAQSITCPAGTKLGGAETDMGKFQWCEENAPGGPIRQGPMVGFHPNGRRSFELTFVDGTPRGSIRAWYEGGQPSMTGETRPDNGTLILWDEQGREERYDEKKLAKAFPANRNLPFIMNLFAVGIGMQ